MTQAAGMRLKPVTFDQLSGWSEDQLSEAIKPMADSCRALMQGVRSDPPDRALAGGRLEDWKPACAAIDRLTASTPTDADVRALLEREFQPYAVFDAEDDEGLFTGYFEVELTGSLQRTSSSQVPLYRTPPVDALRRQTRADIAAGGLHGQGLELVWLDDPIAAFFLDIQGSGKIVLNDGTERRVRYDKFNGFGYRAVGRKLVADAEIPLEEISMQSIVAWMERNPDRMQALMNYNRSYVYFDWLDKAAAQGSQGTDLTPGRSLAIDPSFIPYGAPVWLQTTHPLTNQPLNRLMLAHDKGGAIKGAVRGDYFWGSGAKAAEPAGKMKHQGRYFLLLPKALDLGLRENGSFE